MSALSDWHTISLFLLIVTATFVVNLPFGFMRAKTRKFSIQWFLYIHLPIPLIFVMRTYAGFGYTVVPILIGSAVFGKVIGGRLRKTSCVKAES
jgi:hypothetical protein